MAVEYIFHEVEVAVREDLHYGKDPSWHTMLDAHAAAILARNIITKAAKRVRIEPDWGRFPTAPIVYKWTVGIETDKVELDARLKFEADAKSSGPRASHGLASITG